MQRTCDHCPRPVYAKGLCSRHYQRNLKYGDPLGGKPIYDSNLERALAKLEIGDCWEWTGGTYSGGYGQFAITRNGKRTTTPSHRFIYESLTQEELPDDVQLDHLCHNRRCANPDHLEPVTAAINTQRGFGLAKQLSMRTHCKNGHEYAEGSFYLYEQRPGQFRRDCKKCNAERARERQKKTRAASRKR